MKSKKSNILPQISHQLSLWCTNSLNISQISIVEYGLEILIENILRVSIILAIGAIHNYGIETFISLSCFASLRFHAGGIHAKTNLGCTSLMVFVILNSIFVNQCFSFHLVFFLCMWCLCNILIYKYAPNGHPTWIKLTENYKKSKRNYALIVNNFLFIIALISDFQNLIAITLLAESLSLAAFYYINEEKCNEENQKNHYTNSNKNRS